MTLHLLRALIILGIIGWAWPAAAQLNPGLFSKICFGPCATAPQDTTGAVDPEGSATACPGSTFRRTSGGTTSLYVKQAGTGCDTSGWVEVGSGGGVATTLGFVTKTAEASLSNEFALGSLATGLLKNTTTTGEPTIAVAATDYVAPGAVTTSGLTQATARILGRTTAGTGAIEELTSVPATLGGTGLTALGADDQILVSNGSLNQPKTIPDCNNTTEKLDYDASTNTFSCQTDQAAGGGAVSGPGSSTDNALVRWDGVGGTQVQNSVVTVSDTGAVTFPDGVKQTFNPDGTLAGLNVGAQAGDVGTPANGDLWYNSSSETLRARINGATVSLGSGAGGAQQIGITVDGGGSAYATGVKGFVSIPISGTITSATLLSTDASATACSTVFDVWVDTYANYPPTNADSITASAPPTLSSANKSQDTTLTGWTTAVTAGTIAGFNVDSVTGCTRATLVLTITP